MSDGLLHTTSWSSECPPLTPELLYEAAAAIKRKSDWLAAHPHGSEENRHLVHPSNLRAYERHEVEHVTCMDCGARLTPERPPQTLWGLPVHLCTEATEMDFTYPGWEFCPFCGENIGEGSGG